MYEFRSLAGITRITTVILWTWMATDIVFSALNFLHPEWDVVGPEWIGLLAVAALIMQVLCYVAVARWTYRASVNAHARNPDLEFTPGWAVGWYFVPFMNLFKPFEAMKEIWNEAHGRFGYAQDTPAMLKTWWGLWLGTTIANNVLFRVEMSGSGDPQVLATAGLIFSMLSIPLTLLLTRIMRSIATHQPSSGLETVFA